MRTALLALLYLLALTLDSPSNVHAQELFELRPYSRQLIFTGFTRPVKEMVLSSEVSGKCVEILIDVGDTVNYPNVARIDDTFTRLDIQQNGIAQKKILRQLELEEKTLARFTNLMKNNSTAQANFDEAAFNADNLRLNLQNLKAEEKRLKEMLDRHTLQAPLGWQVIHRYIEPGEYIRQGEPILKLGSFNRLIIPFLLTYEEMDLLQNMEQILLNLPDIDTTVVAEIYQIAPDFNEQKKKISIELITSLPQGLNTAQWRGGLRAKLNIGGKTEADTFLVPIDAIIRRYEANWLISEDGTQKRVILLGTSTTGNDAIITGSNLSAGERVLASPTLDQ
jgi:RND family efflux transporter MFP subunit